MIRAALLLALAACTAPAVEIPGETLGEFDFLAELLPASEDPARCVLDRIPPSLEFGAVLSRDPDSARFWLLPADAPEPREGSLDGRRFSATVPPSGPGYPYVLAACTGCEITVVETIEGELFDELPAGGCADAPDPGDAPIQPALLEGVCGRLLDELSFRVAEGATTCTCLPDDDAPMVESCRIEYRITGVRR